MKKPTQQTEFKVSYDEENVYFFVKSYQDRSSIITQNGKRDNAFWNGDWVIIYIDPLNDKKTGYRFGVNPSNVQHDARLYNDGWDDPSWDAIWYSATNIENDYWTAEFKIPLRAIKFQSNDNQNWGLNLERNIKSLSENSYWQSVDPKVGFKISYFGQIENFKNLKTLQEINVIPSITTTMDSRSDYDPTRSDRVAGLDLRYNFDEQHSILGTIKPDFAQIEADQDQINISDYPLFLQEKRPFFLEGNDLYQMPDEIFYSRRMIKPDYGAKFFGSSSDFKYGGMFVNNDMRTSINDSTNINHKENFFIGRVKFEQKQFTLGYFGAFVDSKYELDGSLSALNAEFKA